MGLFNLITDFDFLIIKFLNCFIAFFIDKYFFKHEARILPHLIKNNPMDQLPKYILLLKYVT